MSGPLARGFFGLVWRILEGIRRVLHLILLLVIFGFMLAALHTSIPIVPRSGGAGDRARRRAGRTAVERSGAPRLRPGLRRSGAGDPAAGRDRRHRGRQSRLAHQADRARFRLPGCLGPVEAAGDRRRAARFSRRRQARGGGRRFARSDPVLPGGAGRRGLSRSDGAGLPGRLQLLPHVLEGRHRQARRRCQRVPRRHVQELHRPILAQRHGAERTRGELGVARGAVERLPAGRHARALAARRRAQRVRGRRAGRARRRQRRCRQAGAAARPGHRAEEPPPSGRRSEGVGGRG